LKRNSNDVGWEYGVLCDPRNADKVKCKLCGKQFSGGIFRMKEHIAHVKGNVAACPVSTKADQDKCKKAILDAKEKKNLKRKHDQDLRAEVNINRDSNVEELEKQIGTLKSPHFQGPIDHFATSINLKLLWLHKNGNKTHAVRQYCARWIFQSNISFNAIDNDSFRLFCEALGQFGPGWVPPSQYQLREPLLNEERQRTKEMLKSLEEEWEKEGCSVMTDAWSDMKRRSIMNLCVNSRGGTCFLSSKDTSKDSHTGDYIFQYIDQWIEDIGSEKIVQVVTDNATNNVAAAKMLKEKRPRIFWTGCAAHTLDLMLEGISKLQYFSKIIDQAKAVTIFAYAHHKTLSLMRSFTKNQDIVRPGATRFATCFLTLNSLYDKKAQLKSMFIRYLLGYIFRILELVTDGEKVPSLGFIYGEMLEAKKSIKEASDHLEKNYGPIFRIIDEKMKNRLDCNWWSTYGCGALTLQKLATRILALTSSSSGCERNWSSFEGVSLLVIFS
ncbi:unnamed protein product, partial [Brassica rapa subsp. trilocularis]